MQEKQFNEILRLSRLYRREAVRCREAAAFVAGCVMLGAALESMLVATASIYWREAKRALAAPKQKGRVRPLAEWDLGSLLAVARELNWLPAGLERGEGWSRRKAKIGDYAEALHQVRNLVHAGYYLRKHSPARVTKRYFEGYFEILDVAVSWLNNKVVEDLRKKIK